MYLKRKGQGAFEYVLLLAGVLLIVVLAVVLLRGGLGGQEQALATNVCKATLATDAACWDGALWDECGLVDEATYLNCGYATSGTCAVPPVGQLLCGPKLG